MRALIVEEDYISRLMLQRVVSRYASECLSTANGEEALTLFMRARRRGLAYDLICLDVRVPEMDGQTLLRKVRAIERRARSSHSRRAKVIMTTALSDFKNLSSAF
jgi:two-component system chemotaxis response regulator CheY